MHFDICWSILRLDGSTSVKTRPYPYEPLFSWSDTCSKDCRAFWALCRHGTRLHGWSTERARLTSSWSFMSCYFEGTTLLHRRLTTLPCGNCNLQPWDRTHWYQTPHKFHNKGSCHPVQCSSRWHICWRFVWDILSLNVVVTMCDVYLLGLRDHCDNSD